MESIAPAERRTEARRHPEAPRPRETPMPAPVFREKKEEEALTYRELLATPEGKAKALPLLKHKLEKALDTYQSAELETLATAVEGHPDVVGALETTLKERVGAKYAKLLLSAEGQGLRENLKSLTETLRQRIGERGPYISREAALDKLLAIHEYFGTNVKDIADAMNLSRHADLEPSVGMGEDMLNVHQMKFDQAGNLAEAQIGMSAEFKKKDAVAEVSRVYRMIPGEHGAPPRKEVEYVVFRLPYELEQKGLAARAFAECYWNYKQMGIQALTLEADINVGRYAWATYGCGFDPRFMDKESLTKFIGSARGNFDAMIAKYRARKKRELGVFGRLGGLFKKTEDPMEAQIRQLEAQFDELGKRDPLTITPQDLAFLGKGGPEFVLGSDDEWYLADELADAQKRAAARGAILTESEQFPKAMHAGKAALIVGQGTNWHGVFPLDGSMNEEMAMKKLFKG